MSVDPCSLRADLHVHSYHSGYAKHLRFLRTRDCYSDPDAVYRVAKARGMDLVTITDHDSIDGCLEFLSRHPDSDDFFISEEIECSFPGRPLTVHVAAYGINERIHREIQRLRANVYETAAYLRSEHLVFSLNHLFFLFARQMPLEEYLAAVLPLFPAFETRNGAMLPQHNALIEATLHAREAQTGVGHLSADGRPSTGDGRLNHPVALVGGSDAHTLRHVGTTYTEAPGRTKAEFLDSLRGGRTRVGGRQGSVLRMAADIYGVVFCYWASLVGALRQDLSCGRRALGLGFSAVSLPAEFVPLLVAVFAKGGEARRVAAYAREWEAARTTGQTMPDGPERAAHCHPVRRGLQPAPNHAEPE